MMKAKRIPFTNRENYIIRESVKLFGEDWDTISKRLPGRTPKQMHDRYVNYLREGRRIEPWSNQEDEILIRMYKAIGPKWSKMIIHLPGRSGNDIKNRWHKHLSKKVLLSDEEENTKSCSSSETIFEGSLNDSIAIELSPQNVNDENFIDILSEESSEDGAHTDLQVKSNLNSYEQKNNNISQIQPYLSNNDLVDISYCKNTQNFINQSKFSTQNTFKNENDNKLLQNTVNIINKVDVCENMLNSRNNHEVSLSTNTNSSVFNRDFDMFELLENFGYQDLDFLWG